MRQNRLWSQDLYLKALRFAGTAHRDQKVPGTAIPYLAHLSSVCMEVMAAVSNGECSDPDLAVQCALLHDVLEDTPVTSAELEKEFGRDVAEGVNALTKNSALSRELKMSDSIDRIKLQPREIWMVKLADRITNLQPPPPHWTEDKIRSYKLEAEYILKQLGSASEVLKERLIMKIKNYA